MMIAQKLGTTITEKFDIPETFIAVTSSLFLIFRKNKIPDNKIIKGNILYNKLGTNIRDKKIGRYKPISISLKKFISSNTFIMKPKQKKIKIITKTILANSFPRYLFITRDLIIILN